MTNQTYATFSSALPPASFWAEVLGGRRLQDVTNSVLTIQINTPPCIDPPASVDYLDIGASASVIHVDSPMPAHMILPIILEEDSILNEGAPNEGAPNEGVPGPIIYAEGHCPICDARPFEPYDNEGHCGAYCAEMSKGFCWGCRTGVLNQQGHMEPGGCLYSEPDSE
jgi:hypothetical protein